MLRNDETVAAGGPHPSLETNPAASKQNLHTEIVQEPGHFKNWPNDLGFNHYPQTHEPIILSTTGNFPPWTAGTLLRIGPGLYKTPADSNGDVFQADHWFDGFTTCHRFEISPTDNETMSVTYCSRGLMDAELEKARRTGRFGAISFGQKYDPCDSFYRKLKTFFAPQSSNKLEEEAVGVSFSPAYHVADKSVISCTTDRAVLKEIDVVTLEPKTLTNQKELHPKLSGVMSAAHPCVDPTAGDVYNFNLDMGATHIYRIFHTKASDGKTEVLATISGADIKGAYIHSLLLTEHFVILCVWPAFFGNKGIDILWKRNLLQAILPFDKSSKCTWYVVDRSGARGVVKKYTSPPMFCFHTVNAWEQTNPKGELEILADLCQFDNLDVLHKFYYENLVSNGRTVSEFRKTHKTAVSLVRYRLHGVPLTGRSSGTTGTAEALWSIQEPKCGDLPTINRAHYSRPYRYVYSVITRGLSSFMDAIGKTNAETGECIIWSVEKHTPGEPIFVQRPGATDEDDGALLIVVLDGTSGTSYLLCLDARDLSEIARADVPVPVSFGFHGIHLLK